MTISEITIDRAVVRYELAAASRGQQPRFDRILSEDVGSGLEVALDEVMWRFGRDAIVCVKRLEIALCLDLSAPDRVLADAWTDAVAAAVIDLVDRGSDDVIVYHTLAQAVSELADAALGGTDTHAWAWNQLGLWAPTDGAGPAGYIRALGRAVQAVPSSAPRVLAEMARRDRTVLVHLADDLPAIATAVLRNAGLPGSAAKRLLDGADSRELDSRPASETTREWSRAGSRVICDALRFYQLSTLTARAWAVIELADSEPVRLRADTAADAIDEWLSDVGRGPAANIDEPPEGKAAVTEHPCDNESAAPQDHRGPTSESIRTAEPPEPDHALPLEEPDSVVPQAYPITEWGGLLFILKIVDDAVLGMLASAPLRPALITTAALLSGASEDDPGVQAFAGCLGTVGQSRRRPVRGVDRQDDAAMAGPRGAAEMLLNRLTDIGFPDAARVVQRRALLRAAPGWLEAEFSIDDVDLDVRRAGLDIDPEWLPWLGTVVKFRYG